jgi:hypothetical protein
MYVLYKLLSGLSSGECENVGWLTNGNDLAILELQKEGHRRDFMRPDMIPEAAGGFDEIGA